ncbi:RNA polymerase sigma factor [Planctomycetes bacterium CA13]|uniref:RNA polymerase sigma factor n=1 Tax=Novipirellula herctigrandis TaxID=2527986 RepID=A0A5C5ZD75_9BACT|nr:RNA polymerase sigma factor [Planctomycetes bacterium CA13]
MIDTEFDDLIRKLKKGDGLAASQLVAEYETEIRRYVRVRLRTSRMRRLIESVDICQSVFAKFFVDLKRETVCPQSPDQLRALLMTMAKNKLIDKARYNQADKRDIGAVEADGGMLLEQTSDASRSPSSVLADKELLEKFRGHLTEEERELIDARMEGTDWAEIATRCGTTGEAMRKRVMRSIEAAAKKIGSLA